MSKDAKKTIEKQIQSKGPISAHLLAADLDVSRQYVHRVLIELVSSGVVTKSGKPPKVVYSTSAGSKAPASENITQHNYEVTKGERLKRNNQRASILWFTGLSGAGKSTLANAVEQRLFDMGKHTYVLDGDNVRHGLNRDLTFSEKDRVENIRRIGEVSKLFVDAGILVLTAFISPYMNDRNLVRGLVENGDFIEIYVKCPLDVCESRDVKGLYKKARDGLITGFTGIDAPYEAPERPELTVETDNYTIDECVDQTIAFLTSHNYIKA